MKRTFIYYVLTALLGLQFTCVPTSSAGMIEHASADQEKKAKAFIPMGVAAGIGVGAWGTRKLVDRYLKKLDYEIEKAHFREDTKREKSLLRRKKMLGMFKQGLRPIIPAAAAAAFVLMYAGAFKAEMSTQRYHQYQYESFFRKYRVESSPNAEVYDKYTEMTLKDNPFTYDFYVDQDGSITLASIMCHMTFKKIDEKKRTKVMVNFYTNQVAEYEKYQDVIKKEGEADKKVWKYRSTFRTDEGPKNLTSDMRKKYIEALFVLKNVPDEMSLPYEIGMRKRFELELRASDLGKARQMKVRPKLDDDTHEYHRTANVPERLDRIIAMLEQRQERTKAFMKELFD